MAGTIARVKKNHTHPGGLKCISCDGDIGWDEKYHEVILPSEVRKETCMICYCGLKAVAKAKASV